MAKGRGYGRGAMEGSPWPKIAALCLVVALLFHLISFGAPNWAATNPRKASRDEHIGLWRYCTYPIGGGQACGDFIDIITGDWLKAAQSFGTLALFTLLAAIGTACMYALVPDFSSDMRILGANLAVIGASFLFLVIECGVFGGCYDEYFRNKEDAGNWAGGVADLSWAFALGVTATVLTFLALICFVLELLMGEQN